MADFTVKNPKELTPEELVEYFAKLTRAIMLPDSGFSTVMYHEDVKEELLRRVKEGGKPE